MERSLIIGALENAVAASTGPLRGLLHHSDQGSQYASHDFAAALAVLGTRAKHEPARQLL